MKIAASILALLLLLTFACADDDDSSTSSGQDDDSDGDDDNNDTVDDDTLDDDDNDDNDTEPPPEYPESCPEGPVFTFDLTSTPRIVPYPNDLYLIDEPQSPTGKRVHIDGNTTRPIGATAASPLLGWFIKAYNQLNGFSTLADLYLPVGVEPVAESIEAGLLIFIDDPSSPYDGWPVAFDTEWREPHLYLTPRFPLKENTHYLLVVTRQLRSAQDCYRASESMREIWTAWATGAKDDEIEHHAALLDKLYTIGVDPDQVLAVADFTTGWMTRDLAAAKQTLAAMAATEPSAFTDWQITPDADPRLFATATAVFDVPIFKPRGGAWAFDEEGMPVVDHVESVKAYFTVPAQDAHPNGQPYPILLFQHGMFNSKTEMRPPFTTDIAAEGFAMVAIDAVCHGDRLPAWMGDIGQFFCFYDIFDPPAWRDNFRESVANWIWLGRCLPMLAEVDLDENGIPDFDVDHVYSIGASLGSILGGPYSALEENIDAFILAAAGGKFASIAREGEAAPYFEIIEWLDRLLNPDQPVTHFLGMLLDIIQSILDPADPANFAVHTVQDPLPVVDGHVPQVFQQGSAYDEVIGGPSGGWLCRAGNWPQITPYAWDVGMPHVSAPYSGSAFYQTDTDDHTLLFDTGDDGAATREQVFHFLRTHLDSGVGEIIDPFSAR